jgi:cytidylate kinase
MKNLQVTIAGEPGAGATTVAQFIQKCLGQVGIEATVTDGIPLLLSDEAAADRNARLEETFQSRLKALAGKEDFRVQIETAQLKRIAL